MKTRNKRETIDLCNEGSGANGNAVIAAAKKSLLEVFDYAGASKKEMNNLDAFLYECYMMNWLRDYDYTFPKYDKMRKALCVVKDAFETDVIWAPGASPTYKQVEKVRKVYKAVCDVLGKKGVKKAKIVSKS